MTKTLVLDETMDTLTRVPTPEFEYVEWLLGQLDLIGQRIENATTINEHAFLIVKTSYLSAVIEAEMTVLKGDTYDAKRHHLFEDDLLNFRFYMMYFKMLYDCEKINGKTLHD